MLRRNRFGENDRPVRRFFVLIVVVERGHAPDTCAHAVFLLGKLEVEALQEHGQALGEEYPAEQGYQEFLAHEHCAHADDAADGETARIAHEYLRREGVVPEEADERAHKGTHEDGNLSGPC